MLLDREPLRPPAGKTTDLPREAEFDSVDYTALARSVWAGDCECSPLKVDVEFTNAPHFLDMDGVELNHFRSPPAGSVKILSKSSTFIFLLIEHKGFSWSSCAAWTSLVLTNAPK